MTKFYLQAALLAFVLTAVPAYAQTTAESDAPADAPVDVADPTPAPVFTPPPTPSPVVSNEPPLTRALREGVPLRVRQEQAYDANGNNRLDPDEIKAFLKSVYQDSSKAPVKNTSDVLYSFDKNKDGYIDRSEASGFSQYGL